MIDLISKYFPEISGNQLEQFAALKPLYEEWNAKINVISRKDIADFYEHHVLHSLAIAKVINFEPNTQVLDLGTGGGFPGLPLAILYPMAQFTLVDSIGKKLKVVDSVAAEIGLINIKTIHSRVEDVPGKFDFVVSRAVTRLNVAWGWVRPIISENSFNTLANGMLYLKGGDISAEMPNNVHTERWELVEMFTEPFFSEKSLIYITDLK